jgi:penicillin-binding protein 2
MWYHSRNNILLLFFCTLLVVLAFRLFQLIGIEGAQWSAQAEENTIRTLLTDVPRGEIYDRNGILLAGNRSVFAVEFSRNDMSAEDVNETAINLIRILEKHEETWVDNFPIRMAEDGTYYYMFDEELALWFEQQQIPTSFTAEQAFNEIRRRYEIPEGMDHYAAQQELVEQYGFAPPILVANMEYTRLYEKRNFLKNYRLDADVDARTAFAEIRKFYGISSYLSDEAAAKIVAIRHELTTLSYMRYMPAEVASGIKQETVVELEENLHNLEGVDVIQKSVRFYPQEDLASHIIGYMGKISDSDKEQYVTELGYRPTDLVGKYGVEKSMEGILHGAYGVKTIQIDKNGEVIRTLSETKPERGEDIALTIDIEFTKKVKENLTRGLEAIQTGTSFESRFGNITMQRYPNSKVAAAAVIDVATGEPIAVVNSDDFDPNLFAEGITSENWNALQGENPRDPLAPRPLYNWATSTAVQPGSTFKPLIAIAGLESGLDPNRTVYCPHSVEIGDRLVSCLGTHGNVNLYSGMQASCNFYFYAAATGRDWARGGTDIGYDANIDIDTIMDYAKQFGLGVESDIELEETVVSAASAERKMAGTENLLKNWLIGQCEYIFTAQALEDKNQVLRSIDEIAGWTEENPALGEIKARMLELGVREDEVQRTAEECKYTYYNYAQWTFGDELNIAIGQGDNAYTPLQMAQYMATLGNGGTKNSLSLIKAKESVGEATRAAGTPVNLQNAETLDDVKAAMRRVVTGGTLSYGFRGLPIETIGKTGTAERAGYINPPDEVAYMQEHLSAINPLLSWENVESEMDRLMLEFPTVYDNPNTAVRKAILNLSGRDFDKERLDMFKGTYDYFAWVVALAPAENPQIAVACLVVQGGTSMNAAPIVREIIGDYFDMQAQREAEGQSPDWSTFFQEDHLDQKEAYFATAGATAAAQ